MDWVSAIAAIEEYFYLILSFSTHSTIFQTLSLSLIVQGLLAEGIEDRELLELDRLVKNKLKELQQ